MPTRLTRSFFRRDPVTLATSLLGQRLIRILNDGTRLTARIVEVEAYLGVADRACHSYVGRRTPRNQNMYLDGGHAYVYFTYGMHWCMNIVSDTTDTPTACLIRALEPIDGIRWMRKHRQRDRETDLCSGPAKLTQALAIDRSLDGIDLTRDHRLWIEADATVPPTRIITTPRIGINGAGSWTRRALRFFIRDNPHVSARRTGISRRRV